MAKWGFIVWVELGKIKTEKRVVVFCVTTLFSVLYHKVMGLIEDVLETD